MKQIAHIETLYKTKFGVPRQAGLTSVPARVVFEPEFRVPEAVRGLETFDYVWLVWLFHLAERQTWSPTVRPPRLGGNRRMGVFATRSPFRPNPIGLSAVRLLRVSVDSEAGPVLYVEGADMVDGTPVFDIKPYLPYADSHPEAAGGFAQQAPSGLERVEVPDDVASLIPAQLRDALEETLLQDPRPSYQDDPDRIYAMLFGHLEVRFRVAGNSAFVVDVKNISAPTATNAT